MDPVISTAIVAAIATGVSTGLTNTATSAIGDAYRGLKDLLVTKFGKDNKLMESVQELEKDPESPGRKMLVEEAVVKIRADKDLEIITAANQLLELVKEVQPKTSYNATLTGDGAIVQGENAVAAGKNGIAVGGNVHGSINMPERKGGGSE